MLIECGMQTTIKNELSLAGQGLHSGKKVSLSIKAAPADTGYLFRRLDLAPPNWVLASPHKVSSTSRATTISEGLTQVMTVEHLLAALFMLGIDNAIIELDGPEIPILDGSGQIFLELLEKAGKIQSSTKARLVRKITEVITLQEARATIVALPADKLEIFYGFFAPPPCGNHLVHWQEGDKKPAFARTFGWYHELEALWEKGLIKGASLDCALLFKEGEEAEMRFPNEPAWHKVFDLIGDLALYRPLQAKIIALGAGHSLHNKFARKLEKDEKKEN